MLSAEARALRFFLAQAKNTNEKRKKRRRRLSEVESLFMRSPPWEGLKQTWLIISAGHPPKKGGKKNACAPHTKKTIKRNEWE